MKAHWKHKDEAIDPPTDTLGHYSMYTPASYLQPPGFYTPTQSCQPSMYMNMPQLQPRPVFPVIQSVYPYAPAMPMQQAYSVPMLQPAFTPGMQFYPQYFQSFQHTGSCIIFLRLTVAGYSYTTAPYPW